MKTKSILAALFGGIGLLHLPLTAVAQPAATTLAATSVNSSNATLHGTVNPNGASAVAYFQYGLTTSYGSIGGFIPLAATNTAQTLPALVVNGLRAPAGTNWAVTTAPSGSNWQSIAASADGVYLAAVDKGNGNGGGIYTSTNSGGTWTLTSALITNWQSIASSADGKILVAGAPFGVFNSFDAGRTWRQTLFTVSVVGVASSADGIYLAAVDNGNGSGGHFYTSTNAGGTWTYITAPAGSWSSIASSADGKYLAAAALGAVFVSTDAGATWTQTSAPIDNWTSIAFSASGSRLAAVAGTVNFGSGGIFSSLNAGGTWTQTSAPSNNWLCVASSADGSRLTAVGGVANSGGIYTSTSSGGNWSQGNAPSASWSSIASSADGSQLAAVANGGGIYTSSGTLSPFAAATIYHYRVVGLNTLGTSFGADMTFTNTAQAAPTAVTTPANGVNATHAILHGTVNPGGATTKAYFRYGPTTNYGSYTITNTLTAGVSPQALSDPIANLTPNSTYHFQLVASNAVGTSMGSDQTFMTLLSPPFVTTLAATSATSSNVTLNGEVNPNEDQTWAWFQFGTTTNYGNIGGFTVLPATNSAQTLPGLVVSALYGAAGTNWTQASSPITNWYSIASSGDGTRLAAVVHGGGIYASTDSGATWTETGAPITNWTSIASSGDGTRMAAVVASGGIYTSTNSGGAWTQTSAPGDNWSCIASSADGTRLAAASYYQSGASGLIWNSADGGATWTESNPGVNLWTGIAVSADGKHQAAVAYNGGIYLSTDYGLVWNLAQPPFQPWIRIASSADGTLLAAAIHGGGIYTATNSGGGIWTLTSLPGTNWNAIAASADGMRLAAAVAGGGIYSSTDGGVNWMLSGAPGVNWNFIASSADGAHLAAASMGGGIYTSTGNANPLTPGTTYHYRAVGANSTGTNAGADMQFTTTSGQAVNFSLNGVAKMANGAFQFGFTNLSGLSFTVLTATNVALPAGNWTVLGAPVEGPSGHYQFTDALATNSPIRFYRVSSP